MTVADPGNHLPDDATKTTTQIRQALADASDGDLTLLVSIFQPLHEDSREFEPRTTAPPDCGRPNDDPHNAGYQDSGRNEVEPEVNTTSPDAGIPNEGQKNPPLLQRSLKQTRIPTPIVQKGLVRARCYLKVQPASSIVRRLEFGQFEPKCPHRAQLDAIWFMISDVERRHLQMQQG